MKFEAKKLIIRSYHSTILSNFEKKIIILVFLKDIKMNLKYQTFEIDLNGSHSWLIKDCLGLYFILNNSDDPYKTKFPCRKPIHKSNKKYMEERISKYFSDIENIENNANNAKSICTDFDLISNKILELEKSFGPGEVFNALSGESIIDFILSFSPGKNLSIIFKPDSPDEKYHIRRLKELRNHYINRRPMDFPNYDYSKDKEYIVLDKLINLFEEIELLQIQNYSNLKRLISEKDYLQKELNSYCTENLGRCLKSKNELPKAIESLANECEAEFELYVVSFILSNIENGDYLSGYSERTNEYNFKSFIFAMYSLLLEKLHLVFYHNYNDFKIRPFEDSYQSYKINY